METPRLLTDDMDIRDTELSMYHGNNGDYYICLKETKRGEIVKLDTRIAMSGGNATSEIRQAVSSLFKALLGQNSDMGERQSNIPDVSGSVLFDFAAYLTGHDIDTVKQMYDDWWNSPLTHKYQQY
jgi:hypothetical protein